VLGRVDPGLMAWPKMGRANGRGFIIPDFFGVDRSTAWSGAWIVAFVWRPRKYHNLN